MRIHSTAELKRMSTKRLHAVLRMLVTYQPTYSDGTKKPSGVDRQWVMAVIEAKENDFEHRTYPFFADVLNYGMARLRQKAIQGGEDTRKFSDGQVTAMRCRNEDGESLASLAREFGLSAKRMRDIVTMKAYRHVPDVRGKRA